MPGSARSLVVLPVFCGREPGRLPENLAEVLRIGITRLFRDFVQLQLRSAKQFLRLVDPDVADVGAEGHADLTVEERSEVFRRHPEPAADLVEGDTVLVVFPDQSDGLPHGQVRYAAASLRRRQAGGDAFGDPECFRMSYATSDENIVEAMRRIKDVLAVLA